MYNVTKSVDQVVANSNETMKEGHHEEFEKQPPWFLLDA